MLSNNSPRSEKEGVDLGLPEQHKMSGLEHEDSCNGWACNMPTCQWRKVEECTRRAKLVRGVVEREAVSERARWRKRPVQNGRPMVTADGDTRTRMGGAEQTVRKKSDGSLRDLA